MYEALRPWNPTRTQPILGNGRLHTHGITTTKLIIAPFGVQANANNILDMVAPGAGKHKGNRHDIVSAAMASEIRIKRINGLLNNIPSQAESSPSRGLQMHVDLNGLNLEGVGVIKKPIELDGFKFGIATQQTPKHVILDSIIIVSNGRGYAREEINNSKAAQPRATRGARASLAWFEQVAHGSGYVIK